MAASQNLHTFNDSNFEAEVIGSELPVLVDFTAAWCGPCKMLSPIVEKLADELAGRVKIGKLDVDDSPATSAKYQVRAVPTVMVFQNGKQKAQHAGLANRDRLVKLLGLPGVP